jgi:hypothetical protein
MVGKPLGNRFEFDFERVCGERHGVIETDQHDKFDQLGRLPDVFKFVPQGIGYAVCLVKLVHEPNQQAVGFGPNMVIVVAVDGCFDLFFGNSDGSRESGDVDAPFVLAAAVGGGSQDQEFPLAGLDSTLVKQSPDPHPVEHTRVVRDRPKQFQRLHSLGHQRVEICFDILVVWWVSIRNIL